MMTLEKLDQFPIELLSQKKKLIKIETTKNVSFCVILLTGRPSFNHFQPAAIALYHHSFSERKKKKYHLKLHTFKFNWKILCKLFVGMDLLGKTTTSLKHEQRLQNNLSLYLFRFFNKISGVFFFWLLGLDELNNCAISR